MLITASLSGQLITVVVGFALTTVVGGSLGYWFQRRNWDHQNERTLAEADRSHATQTCRELSQLMDKRLYRMWQLKWAIFAADVDLSRAEDRMKDYRAVLYDWNDTLNRNLAAAETEFGGPLRRQLEGVIYEGFASIGRRLETRYRELQRPDAPSAGPDSWTEQGKKLSNDLLRLREGIYKLNVQMLQQIRDAHVGRDAPE